MSQYNKVITLLDGSFAVYGDPIAAWESLAYSDAWDKHGTISLVAEMDYFAQLSGASWMEIDGRVYEVETITSEDSDKTVKVTGCSLNVLFDRIVITAKERLQGRLEERIRYLVNQYAITGTQAVTGLTLGTDNAYARAMDATTIQWQTLSEFLYTQLNQRGFSFEITCDCSTGGLVFNITQALDRTQDQTTNPPVQLSTTAEIEKASYKKSIKDFRNYAIVHDDDETNPQVVHVDLSNGAAKRVLPVSGRAVGADDSAATNLYVMVGTYSTGVGYIASSTDGQIFTNRVISGYGSFWGVDYTDGMFTVCGNGGVILTSVDAVSWTLQSSGVSVVLEASLYYDGLYIVTGNSSNILTSYNKTSWELQNTGGNKIVSPMWTGKNFVSFGQGYFYLSKDYADTWQSTAIPSSGSFSIINRAVKCSIGVVGVGYVYNSGIAHPVSIYSDDDFSTYTVTEFPAFAGKSFLDLAYGDGVLVAVGQSNFIAWSDDFGATWTDCTPAGGTPNYIAVCFNSTDGTFHAYSATSKHHAYSSTGKSFTLTTFTTSAIGIDAVIYGTSSHSGNLYQVGVDALQASVVVEALDGDVNQELAPEYEIDYNVGDIIDTLDPVRNIAATKRVYSVDHIIDKDNDYAIVPKLGKDFLTLRQLIAKEIKTMAFKSGVFTSTSGTVNGDGIFVGNKAVDVAFLAKEKKMLYGNGISLNPTSAFYVAPKTGLTATVSAGWGIMEGYDFEETTDYDVTVTSSVSEQTFYYGVRLDEATGEYTDEHVAARTTFVPATDRVFAIAVIPANAVTLTTGMITDTRNNSTYCGTVNAQREALATLQEEYTEKLQVLESTGIPIHASTHATGETDALALSTIAISGVDYAAPATITMLNSGGVFTGGAVTAQGSPNQTVAVSAGSIITPEGKRYAFDAVSALAASAADATNPRIDIVYVTSAGVVTYLAGTAAGSPAQPSTPASGTILAAVARAANDNTIATSDITDQRDFISMPSDFEDVNAVTENTNAFACDLAKKHTKNFSFPITNTTAKTVTFTNVPYGTCDVILTIKATGTAAVTWTLDGRTLKWPAGAPTLTTGYTYEILFSYLPISGFWVGRPALGAAN